MTVSELIEKLKLQDPREPVMVCAEPEDDLGDAIFFEVESVHRETLHKSKVVLS